MEPRATFNIPRTALLAIDCHAGIVSAYANPAEEFIERAAGALRAARQSVMPGIHVQVGFRLK